MHIYFFFLQQTHFNNFINMYIVSMILFLGKQNLHLTLQTLNFKYCAQHSVLFTFVRRS